MLFIFHIHKVILQLILDLWPLKHSSDSIIYQENLDRRLYHDFGFWVGFLQVTLDKKNLPFVVQFFHYEAITDLQP